MKPSTRIQEITEENGVGQVQGVDGPIPSLGDLSEAILQYLDEQHEKEQTPKEDKICRHGKNFAKQESCEACGVYIGIKTLDL